MLDVSSFVEELGGKPIGVFGLGVSGQATVKALESAGVQVIAWDDQLGVPPESFKDLAYLVLSPGVPLYFPEPHDVVKAAYTAEVPIISDVEIFGRVNAGRKVIGITGTNGKSTTAALLHHVLQECGLASQLGGNIGQAVLSLDMPPEGGVFVLELSSYQLDLCPTFSPDISVLLNITQDHLNRHGTMENYVASKAQIFEGAGEAIIVTDDGFTQQIVQDVQAKGARYVTSVSAKDVDFETDVLKGAHNQQNIAAVLAVADVLDLDRNAVLKAIKSFPGLAHRQFPVRRIGDVTFINDSKATNVEATAKALQAYDDIYWIVGGQAKEGGLKGLEAYIGQVCHAFLIGEAADDFAHWMEQNGIAYTQCGEIEKAVKAANDMARSGTVLLSPACASWDQFKSFEARGEKFEEVVKAL